MNKNAKNVLDLLDLKCPLPVLKTGKSIKSLNPGDQLTVKATDPLTDIDIPNFCQENGHKIVKKSKIGNLRTFVIEKGG